MNETGCGVPVVVVNLGHTALGVSRSLRYLGIRVIVPDCQEHAHGTGSRHLDVRKAPDSAVAPEAFRDFLLALAEEFDDRPVLFPTRDMDVIAIDRFRDVLLEKYRICQPEHDVLQRIVDKLALTRLAERIGVPVPKTVEIGQVAGRETGWIDGIAYPVIIKSVFAHETRLDARWERAGGKKGYVAHDTEELNGHLQRLGKLGIRWYLQEFVQGPHDNLVICGGYVGVGGELLGAFTGRKLLQYPEDAGLGTIVETTRDPALVEMTWKLLKEAGYTGMFEAEYKVDRHGTPRLIEINPRHWDQHALGTACGVNLTALAYTDLLGRDVSPVKGACRPAKWFDDPTVVKLALSGDLWRLRGCFTGGGGSRVNRYFSILDAKDPKVALLSYWQVVLWFLQGVGNRVRRLF